MNWNRDGVRARRTPRSGRAGGAGHLSCVAGPSGAHGGAARPTLRGRAGRDAAAGPVVHRRRAVHPALALDSRWHLACDGRISYYDALHGFVPAAGAARRRRVGTDARRGGGFHVAYRVRGHGLLCGAERPGSGGWPRPARRVIRAGNRRGDTVDAARGPVRPGSEDPGRPGSGGAEHRRHRNSGRSVAANRGGGGRPRGARRGGERVKCPFCGHLGDKVVDSRESKEGEVIRRRRECLELRPPVHQLRADRRDPLHGGQEGRQPRAVRTAEADRRVAEGVREAAGERGGRSTRGRSS